MGDTFEQWFDQLKNDIKNNQDYDSWKDEGKYIWLHLDDQFKSTAVMTKSKTVAAAIYALIKAEDIASDETIYSLSAGEINSVVGFTLDPDDLTLRFTIETSRHLDDVYNGVKYKNMEIERLENNDRFSVYIQEGDSRYSCYQPLKITARVEKSLFKLQIHTPAEQSLRQLLTGKNVIDIY